MAIDERLLAPIRGKLERLENEFRHELRSEVPIIERINSHIAQQSGKRVRPALLLLSARLAGYRGDGDVRLAAVVEFIHTATLIHDDIIDEAELRRGQRSVNAIWGDQLTVLLGDYLYVQSMEIALRERSLRVLEVLTRATRTMIEGELIESSRIGDTTLDQHGYLDMIGRKTAALFGACGRLAGLLARVDPEREQALHDYGYNVGMAFQLVDDLLDLLSDQTTLGKPVAHDLVEGKLTLPVLLLLERAGPEAAVLIAGVVERRRIEPAEQQRLLELLREHTALESSARLAAEYGRRAVKGLSLFDDCEERRVLERVPELLLARSH